MKKILAVILSLVIVCAVLVGIAGVTATNLFAAGRLRGSGNIVTKRIEAPDFTAVDASRAVKVVVTDDLTDEIVIEADDNVMEKVLVENRRGTLFVSIDKSVRRISAFSFMFAQAHLRASAIVYPFLRTNCHASSMISLSWFFLCVLISISVY